MWCVVEFEGNSVSIVPQKWLNQDFNSCLWPKVSTGISQLIKNQRSPKPDWITCVVIKVLATGIDSYAKAKKLEAKAEVDSTLEITENEEAQRGGKRRTRRKANISKPSFRLVGSGSESSGEDSSDEASVHVQLEDDVFSEDEVIKLQQESVILSAGTQKGGPPLKSTPGVGTAPISSRFASSGTRIDTVPAFLLTKTVSSRLASPSTSKSTAVSVFSPRTSELASSSQFNSVIPDFSTPSPPPSRKRKLVDNAGVGTDCNCSKRQAAFENKVLALLTEIKNDVKEVLVRNTTQRNVDQNKSRKLIPFELPLSALEQLEELEEWLNSQINYDTLVTYVATFGGKNLKKIVKTILRRVLGDDLPKRINFIGANGKLKFEDKMLCSVVLDACRLNDGHKDVTENAVNNSIKEFFRYSRDYGKLPRSPGTSNNGILQD